MEEKAGELLRFQINRGIIVLSKRLLNLLEDLRQDHNVMLDKLESQLPPNYNKTLQDVDYYTDDKYDYLRKKILDLSNEQIRELERLLTKFDVNLK